jgi:spore germination cell wall hydrolase CwlJ-like protein
MRIDLKFLLIIPLIIFLSFMPRVSITASDNVEQIKVGKIDPVQLKCMAKNIYYEAGGESVKGQAAVARVVMNRVSHGFAKTPCGVIYQATVTNKGKACQFSWVCEGKDNINTRSYRYLVAERIAYDVMINDQYKEVIPKSMLFFHNLSITPPWPYQQSLKIGNHIFYNRFKARHKTEEA